MPEWANPTVTMKRADLNTTDDQFEAIWAALGKSRKGTKNISVDREALMCVMMDHSRFYAQVFDQFPSKQKVPRRKRQ